ncbi:phage holin family protein [Pacificibacter marinus]|uniref:phage holin family protein n=1 Tax=Pacificibacter marinus TaxID=658057 RepID=UPI001C07E8F5|nr:phage holin family protein [Pacificibacter marinus]MBU2867785.1 phage holin family protein [Pacificibacter marinus]
MIKSFQRQLAQGARRAAWATAGTLMLVVGLAFLTSAAWMVLSALRDAQFAALVIGCVYVGFGGVAVAIGMVSNRVPDPQPLPRPAGPDDTLERMAAAFFTGFQSAKDFRR